MAELSLDETAAAAPAEAAPARPRGLAVLAVAAAAWLAFALAVALRNRAAAIDDFFITFRYAQNLAAGHGLVFNLGEHAFGTTAPGYALLLGVAAALTRLPVHWLGEAATVIGLVLMAALAAASARDHRGEALLGGTLAVTSAYVWLHHGGEMAVLLALLAGAGCVAERRPGLAGALAASAVWARPDALVAAAGLGALLWWRRRRLPWSYAIVTGAIVLLGVAAAWWWFGQPLPGTLAAKRAQAAWSSANWPSGWRFWAAGYDALAGLYAGRWLPLLIVGGLAGQVPLFRRAPLAVQVLAFYGLAVSVAYPLLGVPFYTWYAVPGLVAVLYGVAYALGAAVRAAATHRPWPGRLAGAATTLILLGALVLPLRGSRDLVRPQPAPRRYMLYRDAGAWLAANSRPDERFAAAEVGTLGYYSRRGVTDVMGLVSPEVVGRIRQGDLASAFLRHPTPFVVESSYFRLAPIVEQPWFARKYALAAQSGVETTWVRVYRLKPGEELPHRRRAWTPPRERQHRAG
ncbi:MAG TPA: hypothetical protein VGS57_10890 [Thermoanaerobaculia bacterium]|jgi:hypothetical protein|nr:hypothetical protein [Thermoanaerobaculia bacterium]